MIGFRVDHGRCGPAMNLQPDRDLYCLACAGFAVSPQAFAGAVVDELLSVAQQFEEEVEAYVRAGGQAVPRHGWPLRTTRALYAVSTVFQDLIMNPGILTIAQAYLGDLVVRDCLMQTNMPDQRNIARGTRAALSYHRDTKWPNDAISPMYLHAFVLLHDFTRENGATVVVPGTHLRREPGYYFKDTDPRSRQDGIDYPVYEQHYFPCAVPIEAPKGSLVFLDPMTIHSQGINITMSPRSLINVTFRSAAVRSTPALLNARKLAAHHARVPVRPDLMTLLEASADLPSTFGPLRSMRRGTGDPT